MSQLVKTFNFCNGTQSFTMPTGFNPSVTAYVWGAGGGGGSCIIPIAANVATSDGFYNGSNVFVSGSNIAKTGTTGNTAYNNGPGYVTITKV